MGPYSNSTAVIDAQKAMSFGIVSDVVPHVPLGQDEDTHCIPLAKAPRPATLAVKEYARAALSMDLQGAIDFARNLHATVNSSSGMRRKH